MNINQKFKKLIKHPLITLLCCWFVIVWSWTFFTDSLDLAGSKIVALVIASFVTVLNVGISALIVVKTFRYLSKKFVKSKTWKIILIGLPIFSLMDFLISWVTAIIWIGPQGSIDNVLPLGSPTLLLIITPLRYASRFVGFYGLAGFFWLIIFLFIQKPKSKNNIRTLKTTCGALIILSLFGWWLYKDPNGISIKSTVISETLSQRVGDMSNRGSELVIFPEYGLEKIDNSNLDERLPKNDDGSKTYFVGSRQVFDNRPAGHINRLMFGNNIDGITDEQDKSRLIPGGEDLSYLVRLGLRATNNKETLDYFSINKMVNKGHIPLKPMKLNDQTILGSAVCSSIISPKDYQDFTKQGATILTNSASLSIFKGSRIFSWQQKSLAKFMAVANTRYFLQSANSASAYVLDNNGNQRAETKDINAIDVIAKTNTNKTLYTILGEYLVAIGSLIVAWWLITYLRLQYSKLKNKKNGSYVNKTKK